MVIAVVLIAGVIGAIFLPTFPTTDVHPPQVLIARDGKNIGIRYMGGIDTAFVGDFQVTVNGVTKTYPKPSVYEMVAIVPAPDVTCVNVSAFDKAVRVYRPIGWNCT